MKSLALCLFAAAVLTLGLEGALGNPAAPSAAAQPASEQYEYPVPGQSSPNVVPSQKPSAPAPSSSFGGDYGY